jgi:hypothetical protein
MMVPLPQREVPAAARMRQTRVADFSISWAAVTGRAPDLIAIVADGADWTIQLSIVPTETERDSQPVLRASCCDFQFGKAQPPIPPA